VRNYITINNFDLGPDSGFSLAEVDTTTFRIEPVVSELTHTLFWEYGRQEDMHLEIEDESVSFQESILVKILEEIIRNALANTSKGQSLRVCGAARHDHRDYLLAVCGPKLFLRDEQTAWLAKPGGLQLTEYMRVGIGLILAKKLTEASGSRLTVTSQQGEQVCMGFPLPLARLSGKE
jgi:light-regulated signal transduction histidine kinase (bacteriophytochrome)